MPRPRPPAIKGKQKLSKMDIRCVDFGRKSIPNVYDEPKKIKAINCSEQLSTTCSYCGDMLITKIKKGNCTKSECANGFWTGNNHWNRLYYG